jgi:hypothetical protein
MEGSCERFSSHGQPKRDVSPSGGLDGWLKVSHRKLCVLRNGTRVLGHISNGESCSTLERDKKCIQNVSQTIGRGLGDLDLDGNIIKINLNGKINEGVKRIHLSLTDA